MNKLLGKYMDPVFANAFYRVRSHLGGFGYLEPVYADVFRRDIALLGLEDDFYPFGGAANYSLLYILTRIFRECKPKSILELGSGQTSILLDRLSSLRSNVEIITFEHDKAWAERVGARVRHPIIHTPLRTITVNGRETEFYDTSAAQGKTFDLVVVDGPPGKSRYSRYGALALVDQLDLNGSIVVFDDAERGGERQTITAFRHRLITCKAEFSEGAVKAAKHQRIFGIGSLQFASYY